MIQINTLTFFKVSTLIFPTINNVASFIYRSVASLKNHPNTLTILPIIKK